MKPVMKLNPYNHFLHKTLSKNECNTLITIGCSYHTEILNSEQKIGEKKKKKETPNMLKL